MNNQYCSAKQLEIIVNILCWSMQNYLEYQPENKRKQILLYTTFLYVYHTDVFKILCEELHFLSHTKARLVQCV